MADVTASVPLLDAVDDVSAGNKKLLQSEFRPVGSLAVVDQGKDLVAGYTDDLEAAVRTDGPLIVFGDHTRTLKFVDFPFAMGADGIKVFKPREGFYPKYLYRYLEAHPVPSAGYSRHFKFLKELQIARPDLDSQRRIAAILDAADAIRSKRISVLNQFDTLKRAAFNSMFTPASLPKVELGAVVREIDGGTSPNCENRRAASDEWGVLKLGAVTYGRFQPDENKAYIGDIGTMLKNEVRPGDVLMTRKNTRELVGAVAVVDDVRPRLLLPDLIFRLHLNEAQIDARYFQAFMMDPRTRREVRGLSSGSAGSMPNISKARLRAFPIALPPISDQLAFAGLVARIDAERAIVQRAFAADNELFASLQSRAFSGKL